MNAVKSSEHINNESDEHTAAAVAASATIISSVNINCEIFCYFASRNLRRGISSVV